MTQKQIEIEASAIVGCELKYTHETRNSYYFKGENLKIGIPKKKIHNYFELKQKEKK